VIFAVVLGWQTGFQGEGDEQMLAEAISLITSMAQRAQTPDQRWKFLEVPGTKGQQLVLASGDTVAPYLREPLPSAVQVNTVADFADFVKRHHGIDGGESGPMIVYYDVPGLFAWRDENRRKGLVWCPLLKTPIFERLVCLENGPPELLDQKAAYQLMRVDFDVHRVDDTFYQWIRTCKWKANSGGERTVGVGNDSMGRDIELAVANPNGVACPEEFTLSLKVFDEPTIFDPSEIRMAVDVRLEQQKFVIQPFPGQLRAAVELELNAIGEFLHDQLDGHNVPVYRGRPDIAELVPGIPEAGSVDTEY
jgi:hypothetical protein